jgi:hypothetical protein
VYTPVTLSSIVFEIAKVRAIILMRRDADDTDREISNDEIQGTRASTQSSDIEEDHLDIVQEVLHLDQTLRDKTLETTRVPLPKKRSHANTVIAHC